MYKNAIVKLSALMLSICICVVLAACGSSGSTPATTKAANGYNDGTYEGRSQDHDDDEDGNGAGYGTVTLTIEGGKITECEFIMYELDGTLKDDSYGADLSRENRLKAQKAVQSAPKYAQMLVEAGSLDGVDAISGATISHDEFIEAVNDALGKAAK